MVWHLVVTLSSLWFGVAHGSRCPYSDTLEAGGCWPGISGAHSCQGLQRAWVGTWLSWGAGGAGQQELMALGGAGQCSGPGWSGWEAAMQRGEQGKGLCCGGVTGLSWAGCTAVLQRVGPTGGAPPAPEQSCQHSCGSSASPPPEPVSWALTCWPALGQAGAPGPASCGPAPPFPKCPSSLAVQHAVSIPSPVAERCHLPAWATETLGSLAAPPDIAPCPRSSCATSPRAAQAALGHAIDTCRGSAAGSCLLCALLGLGRRGEGVLCRVAGRRLCPAPQSVSSLAHAAAWQPWGMQTAAELGAAAPATQPAAQQLRAVPVREAHIWGQHCFHKETECIAPQGTRPPLSLPVAPLP